MPTKGTTRVTDKQRQKLAEGRIKGKTTRELAKETGLAQSTVMKQVVDPRTQSLIQELKRRDHKKLEKIWDDSIKGLGEDVNHDHPDVRRHARNQFFRVLTAGEAPLARLDPESGSSSEQITWEQFLVIYRKRSEVYDAR